MHYFGNNPSSKDINDLFADISKQLRADKKKKPVEKTLLLFLFAGHGILKDGIQWLLLNEFEEKTGFYKLLNAEGKLRFWAEIYPNAYIIGIFACCRQLYDHKTMSGCISKKKAKHI